MSSQDMIIASILLIFSLAGTVYLPSEMNRKLNDPAIRSRFTPGGLRGAYIYYWIGIVCCASMTAFISYRLAKNAFL